MRNISVWITIMKLIIQLDRCGASNMQQKSKIIYFKKTHTHISSTRLHKALRTWHMHEITNKSGELQLERTSTVRGRSTVCGKTVWRRCGVGWERERKRERDYWLKTARPNVWENQRYSEWVKTCFQPVWHRETRTTHPSTRSRSNLSHTHCPPSSLLLMTV